MTILAAIQKMHEIDRAHDAAMQQLREWERSQHERIEREFREHEARLASEHQCLEKIQKDIDHAISSHREQAARDQLEMDDFLSQADDLIKAASKHTRV